MNIAIDFDDTIAAAGDAKVRYARERFGLALTAATSMRPEAVPLMGEDRYNQMIADVFGTELSLALEPVPGAVESLLRLAQDHDLHVVTARYPHEGDLAQQWLEARGITVTSMNVTSRGSKVECCTALPADVFLEDSVGELARFGPHEHNVALALLETPYNVAEERHEHWHVVPDWARFEALVDELASR